MTKNKKWLTSTSAIVLATMLTVPVYAVDLTQLNEQKDKLVQEINELKSSSQTTQGQVAVTVLKENQSEVSMMQNYILSPADVQLQSDGSYLVHLTIKDPNYWKSFVVNGSDVVMISDNGDTAVVEFTVPSLTELSAVNLHIVVPAINYDNEYITYLQFSSDDANKIKTPKDEQIADLNAKLDKLNQEIDQEKMHQEKKVTTTEMISQVTKEKSSTVQPSSHHTETKKAPESPKNKLSLPVFIGGVTLIVIGIGAWLMRKKRS